MPIFEAHFLVIEENIWFAPTEPYQAVQRSENEFLKAELIIAPDAEDAYRQAQDMIDKFSEANYDGPGDITNYSCRGICQLREVVTEEMLDHSDNEIREIEVDITTMASSTAVVRAREELDVFHGSVNPRSDVT